MEILSSLGGCTGPSGNICNLSEVKGGPKAPRVRDTISCGELLSPILITLNDYSVISNPLLLMGVCLIAKTSPLVKTGMSWPLRIPQNGLSKLE